MSHDEGGARPSRRSSLPAKPVEGVGRTTLVVVACALVLAALWAIRSLIAPLLLGACIAGIVRPWMAQLRRVIGARRAAAAATAVVVLVLVLPIVAVTVPIVSEVRAILVAVREGRYAMLRPLLQAETDASAIAGSPRELLRALGPRVAEALPSVVGTATELALGVLVFVMTVYYVLVDGHSAMTFARRVSPLASQHLDALVREFVDVGRAMLTSIGLTALCEGGVAGIAYFSLGLPSAALLTVLTAFAALLPLGTIIVWGPLAVVLWSQGELFAATVVLLTGAVAISGIDHLARPYLTGAGRSRLHPLLVFVGMFGGTASLGGFGLFAGPLVVALCVAALRLWDREQRARALAGAAAIGAPITQAPESAPIERAVAPGE
ncbi:MAG: AI-2E family transporter [Deltaproteobacteria bacterium]|nr:AI-2E family transporter [Deltaproteobacteria bacterium]